jgi:hypothetical protein
MALHHTLFPATTSSSYISCCFDASLSNPHSLFLIHLTHMLGLPPPLRHKMYMPSQAFGGRAKHPLSFLILSHLHAHMSILLQDQMVTCSLLKTTTVLPIQQGFLSFLPLWPTSYSKTPLDRSKPQKCHCSVSHAISFATLLSLHR